MQQKTPSKGTFIALILIVVVALGLYFYYKGTPSDDATSSTESLGSEESIRAQAESVKILSILNEIKLLKIDKSLFDDPTYKSLVDYTIAIPELSVGRVNPFAPIGR